MTDDFTPRPWRLRAELNGATREEALAAARLLDAAPDMLRALRLTLKRLGELNRDDEAGMRVVLSNAIAKATGEQS